MNPLLIASGRKVSSLGLVRAVLPWIAVVWMGHLVLGGLSAHPILSALRWATDEDLFEPGGMMLGEVVRLNRPEFKAALKGSIALLLFGQLSVLVARAKMTQAIGMQLFSGDGRKLSDGFPTYLLGSLLGASGSIVVGVGGLLGAFRLYQKLDGTLDPKRLTLFFVWLVFVGFLYIAVGVCADLIKLDAFRPDVRGSGSRLPLIQRAWVTLQRSFVPLISLRSLRAIFAMATSAVCLLVVSHSPHDHLGAVSSTTVVQLLIVTNIAVECLWLGAVGRRVNR